MSNNEHEELLELISKLQEGASAQFALINEPVAIELSLSDGTNCYLEINSDGIKEHTALPKIENRVVLTFKDLKRIEKNRANLMRYLMIGRIKLHGNVKELMSQFSKIFA